MKQVVDASVLAKLYFAEDHADLADRCVRQSTRPPLAPDLIWAETTNVIWKRHRRGELDAAEAAGIMADLVNVPLNIHRSESLIRDALKLAMTYDRSVYDCVYVALAVASDCAMVTADRRLVDALTETPLAAHVQWLGELD